MDAPDAVDQDPNGAPVSSGTPLSSTGFENPGAQSKTVKRPRPVKSCTECRSRKLRCDRLFPCSQCQKSHRVCKYSAADRENGNGSDGSEAEVPHERPAKRSNRGSMAPCISHDVPALPSVPHAVGDEPGDGSVVLLLEMSSRLERLEKMLSTHVVPASSICLPKQPSLVPLMPVTIRGLSVKGDLRTRFFGQNSTKVLLNLFDDAKVFMQNMAAMDGVRELFVQMQATYKALQRQHRRLLEPMTVYVDSITPLQKRMADILPGKVVCDRLLEVYIGVSEGFYRVVHIPTFKQEYEAYWHGQPHAEDFLPRLLCMLSIGSRFETDSRGLSNDRSNGVHCPTALAQVRHWLDSLRGKQLVTITTLQVEVLLLHAQRTLTPKNQESWTQLGYIVRQAMTMGLHRDPSEFPQISVFWAENRRRLWYSIVDLDLHVALACNLPCAVREGEYSCQPPRNLDDDDIHPEMTKLPDGKPISQYTQTQMRAYASSTLPYRLKVSSIINRLDVLDSFDEVLELGGKLERLLDDVNCLFPRHHALDTSKKCSEWRMRALLDMHVRRPLLSLYRPFALSTVGCPQQITNSYLKSAMMMLTYMDELDPSVPGFSDVHDMYQLVMKHDIIQAAFSVCYYIKHLPETHTHSLTNGRAAAVQTPPDPSEEALSSHSHGFDDRPMWSTSGLVRAVAKTLDSHIGLIKDSSSDLKDVVALSIVLNSVQAASPEQKLEKIKGGIRRILEASVDALSRKTEGMTALPRAPSVPPAIGSRRTSDMYAAEYGQVPYLENEFATNGAMSSAGIPGEFPLWEFDWWLPAPFDTEQT